MTRFKEWPDANMDVLVGGTPCQSFSVAGLRKGLADPRGNLALTYLAIADRYQPEWLVWENVPGVLSSGGGRDFGSFLGALGQIGYGYAYRVLDAQYFGVAQRRKRVFVVANSRDWRRAAAVLFERESLSGHPAPSRETGEGFAADTVGSLTASGRGVERTGETTDALTTATDPNHHVLAFSSKDSGADATLDLSPTLRAMGHAASQPNGGGQVAVATLAIRGRGDESNLEYRFDGTANALLTPNGGRAGIGVGAIQYGPAVVRRLTPRECERLQGFPDGYTQVQHRNKPAADGPRYKALGNSMAVPVLRWIGERMLAVHRGEWGT